MPGWEGAEHRKRQISDDGLNEAFLHSAVAVTITYSPCKHVKAEVARTLKERELESRGLLVPH